MPSVFYLGATGYIGGVLFLLFPPAPMYPLIFLMILAGSVLVSLVKRHPSWTVNALVRNEKNIEPVRRLGVTVVEGSFADKALITEQSRTADIVFNVADCDDTSLTTAILDGMKQRFHEGKPKGILIHTSGCAIFLNDNPDGNLDHDCRLWNDSNEEDMKSITTSQMHGQVDVPIFKAGEEGYVDAYILCPSGVVGAPPADVPVNGGTIFLKIMAQGYLKAKSGIYVGEGTNRTQLVHIDDLVDYYMRVTDVAANRKDAGASPYARYFIVTTQEIPWKNIVNIVTEELHRHNLLESATPVSVTVPEFESYVAYAPIFSADICIATRRGEGLGWKPRHLGLVDEIRENMKAVVDAVAMH
ncbi:hypothetical protein OF83DRAFT_1066409 [Amylostereum chailletii]|nr:hypothetical protein OF83DRAFT_1066409 [Amylostereum chailletii]